MSEQMILVTRELLEDLRNCCGDPDTANKATELLEAPAAWAVDEWRIDYSAGRPILVLRDCSVIEAEDAEFVLGLVRAALAVPVPTAREAKALAAEKALSIERLPVDPAAQAVDEEAERPEFEKQLLMHRHDANLRRMEDGHYVGALAYIGFKLWKARAALAAPVQSEQEPVAQIYWTNSHPNWQLNVLVEIPSKPDESIDLFAAPVRAAMKFPELMETIPYTTINRGSKDFAAGWNAGIKETRRLNDDESD